MLAARHVLAHVVVHGNGNAVFARFYVRRYIYIESGVSARVFARERAVHVNASLVVHRAELEPQLSRKVGFFNLYLASVHAIGVKLRVAYAREFRLGTKRHLYGFIERTVLPTYNFAVRKTPNTV